MNVFKEHILIVFPYLLWTILKNNYTNSEND